MKSKNHLLSQHQLDPIRIRTRGISCERVHRVAVAKQCATQMPDTMSRQPENFLISIYFIDFAALRLQLLDATHLQAPRPGEDKLSVFQ